MTRVATVPQEEIDQIVRLWADDMTAVNIARHLGITRNTVLGRLNRLGLGRAETERKFEAMINVIADGCTLPLWEAAYRVDLHPIMAETMWSNLCAAIGPQTTPGDDFIPLRKA